MSRRITRLWKIIVRISQNLNTHFLENGGFLQNDIRKKIYINKDHRIKNVTKLFEDSLLIQISTKNEGY